MLKHTKKFAEYLYRIINTTYLFTIGFILFVILLYESTEHLCKAGRLISNKCSLIIIATLFTLLAVLCLWSRRKHSTLVKRLDDYLNRRLYLILLVGAVLVAIAQLFIAWHIHFYTGWDAGLVVRTAEEIAFSNGSLTSYYSTNPNNIGITLLFAVLFKVLRFLRWDHRFALVCVSCLLVNLSFVLTVLLMKRLTRSNYVTAIMACFMMVLVCFSPWIVITYTDTFAILFPVLMVYMYVLVKENEKRRFTKLFVLSMAFWIGYNIKPTVAIVPIAITVIELIQLVKKIPFRVFSYTTLEKCGSLIAAMILSCGIVSICISVGMSKTDSRLDENRNFTMTHYAMMGLNEETSGIFSADDLKFSKSFPNVKERKKANVDEIKRRLNDMWGRRLYDHIVKKTLVNFNDGTFAWGVEGEFFHEILEPKSELSNELRSYFYYGAEKYEVFSQINQCLWLGILLIMPFCLLRDDGQGVRKEYDLILRLLLVGVFLYVTIFEARARYLFCFVPLFFVCAGVGYSRLLGLLERWSKKN